MWDALHYDKEDKGKAVKLDEMIYSFKKRRSDYTPTFNTSIDEVLTRLYNVIDVDRNGKLSQWEYITFLKFRGYSAKDVPQSFAAVDINRDGIVKLDEFTFGGRSFFNTNDESCSSKLIFGPLTFKRI